MIRFLCLAVIATLFIGCGSAQKKQDVTPEVKRDLSWINGVVNKKGKVCAVGYSGATFYAGDARDVASDNCREQLAMNIQSKIVSMQIDWSSEDSQVYDKGAYVSATIATTDAMLDKVEVLDYFYDKDGRYSGDGVTMTYVLCCIAESEIDAFAK